MRALKPIGVALLVCALPFFAAAQTTGSASNVSALLAELQQLEQQITAVVGSSSTVAATTSTPAASAPATGPMCPALFRPLSIGASGSDVASLQTFLASEGVFSAQATGYFGTITQASVASWQESQGIVSGGDADSTGLGIVGPKTRAAISASCSGGTASAATQCIKVLAPTAECPNGWQPVTDASGCTMYFQCTISLPSEPATSAPTQSVVPSVSTTSCPVVQQPICTGTVTPFQTDSNGCVTAYECAI